MADILFVTVDAGGNVQPMLGIAQAVAGLGHDVRVVGHAALADEAARYGLDLIAFEGTHEWDSVKVQNILRWPAMLNDRQIGREVARHCGDRRPDVAVIDCLIGPAHHVVRSLGIPRVVLTHTLREYMDRMHRISRFGAGSPARLYGYRTAELWDSAELNIVTTEREIDPASSRTQPPNLEWTGAVLPAITSAAPTGSVPHVLVSLSTNGFPGQDRILRKIVAALGPLPVTATVTTGGVFDPGGFQVPANVEMTGYADHLQLMPKCSLLIGHGGHSTTLRALAHGLPVVVIPAYPMIDQHLVGKAIRAAAVGDTLSRWSSVRSIRAAVKNVLGDAELRRRAAELGARLRESTGTATAAARIDAVARSSTTTR